jgi:hypothetical protein
MSEGYEEQIDELLEQASGLDNGPAKLALFEEAVRLADACQDIERGFSLRENLVDVATDIGETKKALIHFSWRLAQCDREPDRFSEDDLLWEYKWILSSTSTVPEISRDQIESMLEDMTRRSRRMGYGLRAIYKLRWDLAIDMGDSAKASKWYRLWEQTPRDDNTDCTACEQDDRVRFHVYRNKLEKAIELAQPILQGKLRCSSVPHETLAMLLEPLVRPGRLEEAAAAHLRGYRLIGNNSGFDLAVAQHIRFLALTDNLARGLKLFEKHCKPSFDFNLSACFLLDRVWAGGRRKLKLRLPPTFPTYQRGGEYDVTTLMASLDQECRQLAAAHDTRNGNDAHARRMKYAERMWKRWVSSYPVRSKT